MWERGELPMNGKTQWRKGAQAIRDAAGDGFAPRPAGETTMDFALEYAAFLGWKVFPVGADKKPLIKDWPNAATDDQGQIRAWWERWPEAGIGLVCGQRSGVYVVDIDSRHEGTSTWQDLVFKHGEPLTMQSRTGGGGYHLFFRAPSYELGNSAGKLGRGIDTRGDGGYVVLPPSPHQSGATYEWVQWRQPQLLPRWISEGLSGRRESRGEIGSVQHGERNTTLTSFGGALRNVGADREAIEAALAAINDVAVDPPLPDRDVGLIAKSVSRYSPGQVFRLPRGEEKAKEEGEREWVWYNGLELADLPDPVVEWVLFPLVARGSVTLLTGQWKTAGKTTLLLSGVNAVLHGHDFLGDPTRQSPVVYLYEGPPDEFRQNDHASQLYHPDFYLCPQDENMGRTWAEAVDEATTKCLDVGAELLIVDTKAAWLGGVDDQDNQAAHARSSMNLFADAKLNGIGVIVAAHPTKDATAGLARMVAGSGQWAASAGRMVGLWVHADVSDPRRQIESYGRQGAANNFPRAVIQWDAVTNHYALVGTVEDVADEEREGDEVEAMLELVGLLPDGPQTRQAVRDLAKSQLGLGRNKTDDLLKLAFEQGNLERDTAARGEHVYCRPSDSFPASRRVRPAGDLGS